VVAGLCGVGGDLDPARLAAAPDQHLGLDGAGIADALGRRDGVVDGRRDLAARHGDAVLREQLLALILEEVHGEGVPTVRRRQPIMPRLTDASSWSENNQMGHR
jgi:hypothetical protein